MTLTQRHNLVRKSDGRPAGGKSRLVTKPGWWSQQGSGLGGGRVRGGEDAEQVSSCKVMTPQDEELKQAQIRETRKRRQKSTLKQCFPDGWGGGDKRKSPTPKSETDRFLSIQPYRVDYMWVQHWKKRLPYKEKDRHVSSSTATTHISWNMYAKLFLFPKGDLLVEGNDTSITVWDQEADRASRAVKVLKDSYKAAPQNQLGITIKTEIYETGM